MSLTINGRNLEVTPAIREYVTNKMGRVLKRFDRVIDTNVMLSIEPKKHKAEVTMRLPGKDLFCEATNENLYAAIDLLTDKADRMVIKHKSKAQNHAQEPLKRQESMA